MDENKEKQFNYPQREYFENGRAPEDQKKTSIRTTSKGESTPGIKSKNNKRGMGI